MSFSPNGELRNPEEYGFPFVPYAIQKELMDKVYYTLENKCIGIFESPTGTGKSLTLTCAALRWLLDHEALVSNELETSAQGIAPRITHQIRQMEESIDWMSAHTELQKVKEQLMNLQSVYKSFVQHRQKQMNIAKQYEQVVASRKRVLENRVEQEKSKRYSKRPSAAGLLQTPKLENESDSDTDNLSDLEENDTEEESYRTVKIFFCSRTHSQLAQVVREIKKTVYKDRIRLVSLASRQHLCIHPEISKLNSGGLINERCIDLNRSAAKKCKSGSAAKQCSSSSAGCAFKTKKKVQDLCAVTLMEMTDIEDLVIKSKKMKSCPYYAARNSIAMAQLVMVPYQILLHRSTRLQSGIDIRNSVIIIDEAHNLIDTLAQLHSFEIKLEQLQSLLQQMIGYKTKYSKLFSSANMLSINQIIFIVKQLINILQRKIDTDTSIQTRTLKTYELMSEGDFFNLNLVQLIHFSEEMRFAQKLHSFAKNFKNELKPVVKTQKPTFNNFLQQLEQQHKKSKVVTKIEAQTEQENMPNDEIQNGKEMKVATNLRTLMGFLGALTESAEDGRILVVIDTTEDGKNNSYLKYMLLNPGNHFQDIINEARAIIIAGGTIQPINELTQQLFYKCPERLQVSVFNHVVSPDAVLPFIVSCGPGGHNLCFSYKKRYHDENLKELGMTLQNICNVVPAGIVCFMPSYEFLDMVYKYLQKTNILSNIAAKKRIFREPRTMNANQTVEQLLADYATAVKDKKGAIMLSVVGGKLSEGLNFADDLGRAVLVVGMPYPNRESPELQERMKHLSMTLGSLAGIQYYENLCMKAVNQCIGRSVRHINDYAAVFLIDIRYSNAQICKKLPHWIERSIQKPKSFGLIQAAVAKFFKTKQQQQQQQQQ